MKKWKIYAGVVAVMAVLTTSVCVGSKVGASKASADRLDVNAEANTNVEEVNNSISTDADSLVTTDEEITNEEFVNEEVIGEETVSDENTIADYIAEDVVSNTVTSEDALEEEVTNETKEVVNEAVVESIVNADAKSKTDEAYKTVLEEEVYISQLVSLKSGESYGTTDWKECLNYLRNNYELLKLDSSVDMEKVDSYVFAYNIVESEENTPLEAVNKNVPMTRAKYDPKKVTAYTNKYWENYNPAYPDFNGKGGDCANFVSQAVRAGGKPMEGSVASNFGHWFCRSKSDLKKISSTWRGADAFGHYWKANAKGYKTFNGSVFNSKQAQQPVYNYTNVGDAISVLNYNGRPYHTLVVSYKNRVYEDYPNGSKMIHIAAHTNNHKWKSLYNKYKGSDTSIRVYDMY